jgi:hypothetical protein
MITADTERDFPEMNMRLHRTLPFATAHLLVDSFSGNILPHPLFVFRSATLYALVNQVRDNAIGTRSYSVSECTEITRQYSVDRGRAR